MCQLSPVTFHGDTIFCVTIENQPFTPVKPIVENLGLGWASQTQKLNSNRERWGVTIIVIPSESGDQETLCLPVRKLPAFLASINPKKVRAELRERIELYQAECDDALWNYWMNGRAERQPEPFGNPEQLDSPISRRTDPERKALTAIINTWVSMAPVHYASARAQVNAHFGVASVDALTVAQVKEAIQWVQAKIDALPPALPTSQSLPIYRDGMYHLPPVNPRHKAGPQEAALLALQKEWFWRDGDIKRAFDALEKELDARVTDLFHHAISDLGRNADTCFSVDTMTEGLRCARTSARRNFDEAMDCLRLHLNMALNVAVMLGR